MKCIWLAYLFSGIFTTVSFSQENVADLAEYQVQRKPFSIKNSDTIFLNPITTIGRLWLTKKTTMYWEEPVAHEQVLNDNQDMFAWADESPLQHLRYYNSDSGIWRGASFFIDDFRCSKGNWNPATNQWRYLSDTQRINGLFCRHAQLYTKVNHDVRIHWDVWYSEEIPVLANPMDMFNLPGIVVQAYQSSSNLTLQLQSFGPAPVIDFTAHWKLLTCSDFTDFTKPRN